MASTGGSAECTCRATTCHGAGTTAPKPSPVSAAGHSPLLAGRANLPRGPASLAGPARPVRQRQGDQDAQAAGREAVRLDAGAVSGADGADDGQAKAGAVLNAGTRLHPAERLEQRRHQLLRDDKPAVGDLEPCLIDRKSTRLNSSHPSISYA